jgi:hypothetical protein
MSSTGPPISATASSLMPWRRSSSSAVSRLRVSASTITRSVPLARSTLPNTATQPRRMRGRSPIASSSS